MQAVEVVPAGQRVARAPERVESGAAGDEDGRLVGELVSDAFEQILPLRRFVQLVEHHERSALGPGEVTDDLAVSRNVPVQVLATIIHQGARKRGLAALAGAGQQHHLFQQIPAYNGGQIPHMTILKPTLVWSRLF